MYLLLLRSLRHDFDQKNIVLLLLLRSLRHDYNKKANYFSFQHYFHYTVIRGIKYCFTIASTFTTPWQRQKINLFSFQHHLHYKVLEVQCFWKICTWYSSFTVRNFSRVLVFFFLRKFSVFKRFCAWYTSFIVRNFSGVLHALLPKVSTLSPLWNYRKLWRWRKKWENLIDVVAEKKVRKILMG